MKKVRDVLMIFFIVLLLFSLVKSILNYKDKFQFYQDYKSDYDKEVKRNIELKTQVVKNVSTSEIEKTIRNKLNLLKPNEVAIILPSPSPTPILLTPTPIPSWRQWFNLFF